MCCMMKLTPRIYSIEISNLSYSSVYNSVGFMFIDPNNRAIKTFLSTEPSLKFKPFYYIATDNCVPSQYYN